MKVIQTPWATNDGCYTGWQTLCVVYDDDSLAVVTRALTLAGVEWRLEPAESGQ